MTPRLLDLFCGAGGTSEGYRRAGWRVYGVDLNAMPHYPFAFHRGDALDVLRTLLAGYRVRFTAPDGNYEDLALADFDAIHASPPCQAYSVTKHSHSIEYPELIDPARELLIQTGLPYVIENVVGAPLHDPITLCGSMFDLTAYDPATELTLELRRHRLFESNMKISVPGPCHHGLPVGGVYGGGSSKRSASRTDWPKGKGGRGGYTPHAAVRHGLMGIDWMNRDELSESIPPAYTHHLGAQLMAGLGLA